MDYLLLIWFEAEGRATISSCGKAYLGHFANEGSVIAQKGCKIRVKSGSMRYKFETMLAWRRVGE